MKNGFPPDTRAVQIGMIALTVCFYLVTTQAQTPLPSPSPAPTPITKTGSILVNNPSTVGRIAKWTGSSSNGIGIIGNSVITESSLGTIGIGTNPFSDFKLAIDGDSGGGLYVRSTGRAITTSGLIFSRATTTDNVVTGLNDGSGNGVFGFSTAGYGLHGHTNSNVMSGVYGRNPVGAAGTFEGVTGVYGRADPNNNPFNMPSYGVRGESTTGVGVSGSGGIGVFGESTSGWAGFFQGNVNVTGLLSTGNLFFNPGGTLKFADGTIQSTAYTGQINQSQVTNLISDLSSKANNSLVVHLAGAETITGAKTFSGFQLFSGNVGIGMHGPTTDTLLNVGGNTGVVAGTFVNNHNTSENDALFALHTGRGTAFRALNTQVIGRAGFFENSHSSSSSPVLETLGHGSGPAFKSTNSGAGLAGLFEGNVTVNGNLNVTSVNANNLSSVGTINSASNPVDWSALKNVPESIASGQVVNSINGLSNAVTLVAGDNVTITPSANMLTISAAGATGAGLQTNPLQVATLRWYEVNESGPDISVGNIPLGMAFDGNNMWVVNSCNFFCGGTISKVRTSDGVTMGNFPVGDGPIYPVYDGQHIWVSNRDSNNITKLRASDGTLVGTYPTGGTAPHWMAFDGANIWVSNNQSNNIAKIRAKDGTLLATYPTGAAPAGVAYDGANIWVANINNKTVNKYRASDGVLLGSFPVVDAPFFVTFDGSSIWVGHFTSNVVSKLRVSDGATLGTFLVGNRPHGIAFDGNSIWVANINSATVTKLRPSDGTVLATTSVGNNPWGLAFDGISMWVSNNGSNSVSKR